jgi:hypothetical protein
MRNRITLLVAATMLALTMALGGAGAAFAQTPAEQACAALEGEFISDGGNATCVVVEEASVTTTKQCAFNEGGQRFGEQTVTTTTTTTTTIEYRGQSAVVESTNTETETTTETGECANVPGPR